MNDTLYRLLEWSRDERRRLLQDLKPLERGLVRRAQDRGDGWVDISDRDIERMKTQLAQLDIIIASGERHAH